MPKMNFIGVTACLGLLFGILFQFVAVSADGLSNTESVTSPIPSPGGSLNRNESTVEKENSSPSYQTEQSQPPAITTATIATISSSSNDSPTTENQSKVSLDITIKETTSKNLLLTDSTNTSVTNGSDPTTPSPSTDTTAATTPSTKSTTTSTKATTTVQPTTSSTKPTPTDNPTTTVNPSTEKTSTTPLPTTTASTVPPTTPTIVSTKAAPTQAPSDKPAEERRFDGPSFIGGIVFALGVTAIAFVAWKFYKARTERNYHTL